MSFEGITHSEFAETLLHREIAGSGCNLSKQRIGFWERRAGSADLWMSTVDVIHEVTPKEIT